MILITTTITKTIRTMIVLMIIDNDKYNNDDYDNNVDY